MQVPQCGWVCLRAFAATVILKRGERMLRSYTEVRRWVLCASLFCLDSRWECLGVGWIVVAEGVLWMGYFARLV